MQWYIGTIVLGVVLSFGVAAIVPISPMRCLVLYGAVLYLAAAMDRPHVLFLMLRSVRWLGLIRDDIVVRWIMVAIAVLLAGLGLYLPS